MANCNQQSVARFHRVSLVTENAKTTAHPKSSRASVFDPKESKTIASTHEELRELASEL